MNRLKLIAAFMVSGGFAAMAAPSVQVRAAIDSVVIMQGALRQVDVEVIQPASLNARWLTDPVDPRQSVVEILPGVEVNYSSAVDTTDLGNGRLQLRRTLL
ncbi:MAG: hypothetical protein J6J53_03265, partial [Muribaculaceae bacterium]|nr:hypothetical protein [Muribaculaceae bacterium]